jgi:uncharacterized protein VirK/YbjX
MSVFTDSAAVQHEAPLVPLALPARRRTSWSPWLLAGVIARGAANFGAHRKVLQLLKRPALAEIAQATPRFAYKYLSLNYLARGLNTAERASCFLHHYGRLSDTLPDRFLHRVENGYLALHEIRIDDNRFTISMGISKYFDMEGEMSLYLHVNGEIVYLLAFTIVPGAIVESEAGEVILISRLQGMKGSYRDIHLATKSLHDIAPAGVLLSAVQGIGDAFGIREIASVTAARQSAYGDDSVAEFEQSYNELFLGLGLHPTEAGFFRASIPLEGKPLSSVKKGHKLRTKQKRAFKHSVQSACATFLLEHILNPIP